MTLAVRAIAGLVLAAIVGAAGYRTRSLSSTGAIAAGVIGAVAVAAGWNWAGLLIAYFGSSTLLSRLGADRKRARLSGVVDKTGARDATQVMANGFPFFFCATMWLIAPFGRSDIWWTCAAASLAASAADTWATEIGTLVGHTPRSILTWRRMTVGESGGVTLAGWLGAIAGATFVAGCAIALDPLGGRIGFLVIVLGGMIGAVADSLVGATLQRRSWCDVCGQGTEMRVHSCGTSTRHTGGLRWLENDGVNLVATTTGALVPAAIIWMIVKSGGPLL